MVNQRGDASVRVELRMRGRPVLVLREVDIDRVVVEAELLEDDRDLPIRIWDQYAGCASGRRRCSPSVRGSLVRVEGEVLLLGHGGPECTVEDAWVGGCGRTEELPSSWELLYKSPRTLTPYSQRPPTLRMCGSLAMLSEHQK